MTRGELVRGLSLWAVVLVGCSDSAADSAMGGQAGATETSGNTGSIPSGGPGGGDSGSSVGGATGTGGMSQGGSGDGGGGGPTPFVVTDDFQRASLGSSWVPAGGGENLVILDSSIAGNDGNSSFGCRGSQWTANDADWGLDTYAQVTLPLDYTQGTLLHVGVRVGGDGSNQDYGCGYYANVGPCPSGWILKRDGGPGGTNVLNDCPDDTETCYFACGGPEIPAPVGGEVIRIESRWNPSTATNDVECIITTEADTYQYQGSDSVLTLPGRPRIVTCEGTPGAVSRVFEDWEAGNL